MNTRIRQKSIGQKIMESPAVLSISYTASTMDMVNRMLSTLGIVIIVLIVSAGMLAFVVLYNLNNINITETPERSWRHSKCWDFLTGRFHSMC